MYKQVQSKSSEKHPQFAREHSRKQESNWTVYFIYRYALAIDVPGEDLPLQKLRTQCLDLFIIRVKFQNFRPRQLQAMYM